MHGKSVELTKYNAIPAPEFTRDSFPLTRELHAETGAPSSSATQVRIIGLDICRSVAILATMFSHALAEGGAQLYYSFDHAGLIWLRLFLQMSPPIFIILFGSVLEIVYRPRIEAGQKQQTIARLLTRAAQCYLLYLVTLLAMLAAGLGSPGYALRCALFLGGTPYGDILKFYTLALALAPALIFVRDRLGFLALGAVSVAVHLLHPLIMQLRVPETSPAHAYLSPLLSFLIGGGEVVTGGPSFLHGMTFVIWGMMIGRAVIVLSRPGSSRREIAQAAISMAALLLVSGAVLLAFWNFDAPFHTVRDLSSLAYRNINHPIYFAFGLFGTLLAVFTGLILYDGFRVKFGLSLGFAGKTSLFTFSFGNALLYLAPAMTLNLTGSWIYTFALFFLVCLQSYAFNWLQTARGNWLATRFQALIVRINSAVGWLPKQLAAPYGGLLGWR
ncbi:Long-chain-fatty-acid--CoA ligase [Hyphomonas sp. NPDC076900]|uniref:Long-chain-fatty-acid--CoA ligase n=1 Tax=unclassified Hyphomonas TaxID=2630699 RepID=UPI003D04DC64